MSKEVKRHYLHEAMDISRVVRNAKFVVASDHDAAIEALLAERDAALSALRKLAEVARGCERLASDYSGCIDGVDEHGGDDHEDPICAVFHRLYYAMFDADAAIAALQGEQP